MDDCWSMQASILCPLATYTYEDILSDFCHRIYKLNCMPNDQWSKNRHAVQNLFCNTFVNNCLSLVCPPSQTWILSFNTQELNLRATQYLPDIVKLQHDLFNKFHRRLEKSKAKTQTIRKFLTEIENGIYSYVMLQCIVLNDIYDDEKNLYVCMYVCMYVHIACTYTLPNLAYVANNPLQFGHVETWAHFTLTFFSIRAFLY